MTRRRLRPDEIELWAKVAQSAHKLHPDKPPTRSLLNDSRKQPAPKAPATPRLRDFTIGEALPSRSRSDDLAPTLAENISSQPVNMDAKSFARLKRGKLKPEARIDLHGMTLAEAHPVLMSFVLRSHAEGRRLVLVITGKGKRRDSDGPMPMRQGVLRHQVPQWLAMPPVAQAVLQVSEAHLRHGGTGAFYIYLRRSR